MVVVAVVVIVGAAVRLLLEEVRMKFMIKYGRLYAVLSSCKMRYDINRSLHYHHITLY